MQSPQFTQSNQENHLKFSYLGSASGGGGGVRVAREAVYHAYETKFYNKIEPPRQIHNPIQLTSRTSHSTTQTIIYYKFNLRRSIKHSAKPHRKQTTQS